MTVQHSFSKIEKELLPSFRQQIGSAESLEDVRKFFVHTVIELVNRATEGEVQPRFEDVVFHQKNDDECEKYRLSDNLRSNSVFNTLWQESDLQNILDRFAYAACNRYIHLQKKPEKTEQKIRM